MQGVLWEVGEFLTSPLWSDHIPSANPLLSGILKIPAVLFGLDPSSVRNTGSVNKKLLYLSREQTTL